MPTGAGAATHVSFHPYDHDRILTTGEGVTHLWHVQRLWDKFAITPARVRASPLDADAHTAHAWHPQGAYIGTPWDAAPGLTGMLLASPRHLPGTSFTQIFRDLVQCMCFAVTLTTPPPTHTPFTPPSACLAHRNCLGQAVLPVPRPAESRCVFPGHSGRCSEGPGE